MQLAVLSSRCIHTQPNSRSDKVNPVVTKVTLDCQISMHRPVCGERSEGRAIQLLGDEKSEQIIHHDKNEPLTFLKWQLGMWCYFCEALVILIHSWRDSSSAPTLQTSLGKYNSGYDLWLWLLTFQAWNKHMLVNMVAGPLTPVPQLVEEIAADTPAFSFCAVVEDMWLFTTSLKAASS